MSMLPIDPLHVLSALLFEKEQFTCWKSRQTVIWRKMIMMFTHFQVHEDFALRSIELLLLILFIRWRWAPRAGVHRNASQPYFHRPFSGAGVHTCTYCKVIITLAVHPPTMQSERQDYHFLTLLADTYVDTLFIDQVWVFEDVLLS